MDNRLVTLFVLGMVMVFATGCVEASSPGGSVQESGPEETVRVDVGRFVDGVDTGEVYGQLTEEQIVPLAGAAKIDTAVVQQKPTDRPDTMVLRRGRYGRLPDWSREQLSNAHSTWQRTCDRLAGEASFPNRYSPLGELLVPNQYCDGLPDQQEAFGRWVRERFRPYRVGGPRGNQGTFTGYFEHRFEASRTRSDTYAHPVYRPPEDLVQARLEGFGAPWDGRRIVGRVVDGELVPYPGRRRIRNGSFIKPERAVVWARDPVDVLLLHVQGSGIAVLPDGTEVRVDFAATNGRTFTGVGSEILREGYMDDQPVNMPNMADWLRDHPKKARDLIDRNKRYVFFRESEAAAPVGSLGVRLSAMRSLAVDPALVPLGLPVWVATDGTGPNEGVRRLMLAHDTGAAIQGVVRGDVYMGSGEAAFRRAGRFKQGGRYWVLLPKGVAEKLGEREILSVGTGSD